MIYDQPSVNQFCSSTRKDSKNHAMSSMVFVNQVLILACIIGNCDINKYSQQTMPSLREESKTHFTHIAMHGLERHTARRILRRLLWSRRRRRGRRNASPAAAAEFVPCVKWLATVRAPAICGGDRLSGHDRICLNNVQLLKNRERLGFIFAAQGLIIHIGKFSLHMVRF